MKTFELQEGIRYWSVRDLRHIYKQVLGEDLDFHYFFEPNLIIRTGYPDALRIYLRRRHIAFREYSYPYPRHGYGEPIRYKYMQFPMEMIYHYQSIIALYGKETHFKYFANRMHHCFLNMNGFSYRDEAAYMARQAAGYMEVVARYSVSPIYKLLARLQGFVGGLI